MALRQRVESLEKAPSHEFLHQRERDPVVTTGPVSVDLCRVRFGRLHDESVLVS